MVNDRPLRGIAIHNPRLLSKQELVEDFVVRTSLLDRIAGDLRAALSGSTQPHTVIVGQRGMGKTTLLRRLRFLVEDDPELQSGWLALDFPEEQYNIDRLSALWLNCLDALSDALEARGESVEELDDAIEALGTLEESQRSQRALEALVAEATRRDVRLLLLVDNLDLVLDRIKSHDWSLRRVLSEQNRLALVGASSRVLEATYAYDAAFYDFFQIEELKGLSSKDAATLLTHLGHRCGAPHIADLVQDHPERIEPIRILSGGNPRTLALLTTILSQGTDGDVRTDLEQLLDRCTPLYKARFEELSQQAQKIVHELAIHWHPTDSSSLAKQADIPSRTLTGQLDRLCRAGVVQKVQLANDRGLVKRQGYQLAERFFNIWYLMRASRRVRRRLVWLVEFLRLVHTPAERRRGASTRLQMCADGIRDAETDLAYAQVVDDPMLRGALEHRGVATLATDDFRKDFEELLGPMEDLEPSLRTRAERLKVLAEAKACIHALDELPEGLDHGELWRLLGGSMSISSDYKHKIAAAWTGLSHAQKEELVSILREEDAKFTDVLGPRPWSQLSRAHIEGFIDKNADGAMLAGAMEAALVWGDNLIEWTVIARSARQHGTLRDGLQEQADLSEFLNTTRAATLWRQRANLLEWEVGRPDLALAASAKALKLSPEDPRTLYIRGCSLMSAGRHDEAEAAFRASIAGDDTYAQPWNGLGNLLKNHLGRYEEAEAAYRKAITRDDTYAHPWIGLGNLLSDHLGKHDEAEAACRKAVRLAPDSPDAHNGLAWHLHIVGSPPAEALEHASQAARLAPDDPRTLNTYACCLVAAGRIVDARTPTQSYIQLGDDDFHTSIWPDTLHLFGLLTRVGHAQTAIDWLEEWSLAERWLPLRIALQAIVAETDDVLLSIAPEIRHTAKDILTTLRSPSE